MNIGHYCPCIWSPGGLATYIRNVSDWQTARGHSVVFLTAASNPGPADPLGRVTEPVADGRAVLERAAELQLDVLHLHMLLDADLAASPVPVVRTVHGHQPYCPSGSRHLLRPGRPCDRHFSVAGCLWGHVVNRCGSVRPNKMAEDLRRTRAEMRSLAGIPIVTVSNFIRSQLIADGYEADLIRVIYLSATAGRSSDGRVAAASPETRPTFSFVGRVTTEKGVDWFLRAVAIARVPSDIHIVGDGPKLSQVRELANRLDLAGRVQFHGWVDPSVVAEVVNGSTALVFPSEWHEPGATALIEAMANGRAVIASRVGGVPEIMEDGITGLLVNPGDTAGLAAAMDRMASDTAMAARMGAAAQRIAADRFTVDAHMGQLMEVYSRLARRPRTAVAAGMSDV